MNMENLRTFIDSGILESYVFGNATLQETGQVEEMAASYNEVRVEIDSISEAFQLYAFANAVHPSSMVKHYLLATIDYSERLKNGEQPSFPPALNQGSKIGDYSEWLNRPDMAFPLVFDNLHIKVIGYTPAAVTAIVWINDRSPEEVHHDEYEKFLIVEGTCDITIGEDVYSLSVGDYFSIPLHKTHQVIVTSSSPCKVIFQRLAA